MQILKKKEILTTNNFENYSIYLKNLNFLNKLKKKEKTILKDTYILNLKNFYLLNLNSKENLFPEKKNLYNLNYNNKNLLYMITKNKNKKDLLINFNFITYFILNLYAFLLFKKLKKYKIKKFYIKTNNKNKEIFYKKIRKFYPYIKGRILKYKNLKKKKRYKKKKNRKFLIVSFFPLIQQLKSYKLYKKKKNISFIKNFYLKKRYVKKTRLKNIFKKFRKKKKIFKINFLKLENLRFNCSRKAYVFDFNNKNKKKKKIFNLYNLNLFKKYSKIFIEK